MTSPPPNPSAMFIVLEGIDGSGTTTQSELLARHLRQRGRTVLPTREPSTGPVGSLLRELLMGQHRTAAGTPVDGRAMALLFAADRRDHLSREIEPALASGCDVISDRYVLSSLAYQAVEADRVWVERLAEGVRVPDLTLLLDVSISVASARRLAAGRPTERYDADGTLDRVATNYRHLARSERVHGPIVVLDASGTVDAVGRSICDEVDRLLDQGKASP